MQLIFIVIQLLLGYSQVHAAILPLILNKDNNDTKNMPLDMDKVGYVEIKPNGTLILKRKSNQNDGNMENLILLRGVLQALKFAPLSQHVTNNEGEPSKLNIKIYGEGVEHKFPPILENIIQRIQTYFSIYRYTDTSRPIRKDELILQPQPEPQSQAQDQEQDQEIQEDVTTTIKPQDVIKGDQIVNVGEKDAYITVGENGE